VRSDASRAELWQEVSRLERRIRELEALLHTATTQIEYPTMTGYRWPVSTDPTDAPTMVPWPYRHG
jgi:hypothetical protein